LLCSGLLGAEPSRVEALELELLLADGVPLGARSLVGFMPLSAEAMPGLVPFGVGTDCTRPMAPGLVPPPRIGIDCTAPGAVRVEVGAVDGVVRGWVPLLNSVPFGARLLLGLPLPGAATPGLVPFGVGTDCTRPMTPGLVPLGVGIDCTTPGPV
jgi:hypothetical protein